jgi:hypothetical protein
MHDYAKLCVFILQLTVSIVLDLLSAIAVMYGVLRQVIQSEFSKV